VHLSLLSGSSMQVCGIRCRNPGRMTASFQWYQTPQNPETSATKKEKRLQTCANENVTWSSHRKKMLVRLPPKEKINLGGVDFEIGYNRFLPSLLPSFCCSCSCLDPKAFCSDFVLGFPTKGISVTLSSKWASPTKSFGFFCFYKVSV